MRKKTYFALEQYSTCIYVDNRNFSMSYILADDPNLLFVIFFFFREQQNHIVLIM